MESAASYSESSSAKRLRQSNYTADEKSVLLQLVQKYLHILENKKTDAVTNVKKDETWKKIALEFNCLAPNNTKRDATSLKKAYLNIKKNVRKEVADGKMEIIKTGGGTAANKPRNPLQEMALQTMNRKTVFGHHNPFDSDHLISREMSKTHSNDNGDLENSTTEVAAGENMEFVYLDETSALEDEADTSNNWRRWNSQQLQRPLDENLAIKINSVCGGPAKAARHLTETNNKPESANVKNRRRPAAMALHSSEIGKIYTKLCEERFELAQMEKNILQSRMTSDKTKQELEIEILRTDLEIKNKN